MKLLIVGGFSLLASLSLATPVWYNGDDDGLNGWVALSGTPNGDSNTELMAFEDFTWSSSSNAGSIMGTMIGLGSFSQVKWEIRTGMDVATQNLGTLVASGTSNVNLVSLGAWSLSPDFTEYSMTGNIAPVALTNGGSYFLGMAIVVPNSTFNGGIADSGGVNAVGTPVQNHNGFHTQPNGTIGYYQAPVGNPGDLSMGIGTSTVPEPASFAVLGLGALALIKRKRQPRN